MILLNEVANNQDFAKLTERQENVEYSFKLLNV